MPITWAARTHTGLRRQTNEDHFCARADLGLFIVADGMGGHAGGEIASGIAVQVIEQFIAESASADRERTWPFAYDASISHDANRLRTAFRLANRRIAEEAARRLNLRGMATTASGLLTTTGQTATAAHVGDSRIYRLRGGALTRLSEDHSWVEEQVRAGVLDARAASRHPWRNVVTRALSGIDDPKIDLFPVDLAAGDRFLICSDGLFVAVEDAGIAQAMCQERTLDALCDQLVSAANAAGGPDNITVLTLEVHAA
jgi:protein phosphatase